MGWMENAMYVVVTGATIVVMRRIVKYFTRRCPSKALLMGKTILITGANTGIGKATALELARRQGRVIMACRDMDKAERAASEIRQKVPGSQVLVKKLDLASFQSIREFCREVKLTERKIDILINNAAVFGCPYAQTEDGIETHWSVNHFGNFLLTHLLLELLHNAHNARVVFVSSSLYKGGKVNFDDFNSEEQYRRGKPYPDSKLGNLLFARELHRREGEKGRLSVYTVSPGFVNTDLSRYTVPRWLAYVLSPLAYLLVMRTPTEGGQVVVYCSVAPDLEGQSGFYYSDCKQVAWTGPALDDASAKRLWGISEKVCELN